jgi:hypothetical protein
MMMKGRSRLKEWENLIDGAEVILRKRNERSKNKSNERMKNQQKTRIERKASIRNRNK